MSKPLSAPIGAIPFPPPGGPFLAEQVQQISQITTEVNRENSVAKMNWEAACHDWTLANMRNRDMGLPLTPKPAPFIPQSVQTAPDTDENSGVMWLWISLGSPVECADLPAVPVPLEPNHIHIGNHLYGQFWDAAQDNTYYLGDPVPGTSDDGVSGVWKFFQSPMGLGKGWYLKQ